MLSAPLRAFPLALLQLSCLRHLCLRTCGLRALPPGIKHLTALQALVLTDNDIAALPAGEAPGLGAVSAPWMAACTSCSVVRCSAGLVQAAARDPSDPDG